jgi:hypothetical protein
MVKHQTEMMPGENTGNIDPLALDDEFELPMPTPAETADQDPFDCKVSLMVNAFVGTFLSIL